MFIKNSAGSILLLALFSLLLPGLLYGSSIRINEFSAYPSLVPAPGVPSGEDWRTVGFDDSSWGSGLLPIGMDSGPDYFLRTNLYSQMFGKASSLYLRQEILVDGQTLNASERVILSVDYDDAFVLYLNGTEVARGNIGQAGIQPDHDAFADGSHRASNDSGDGVDRVEVIDLGLVSDLFIEGTNSLAVQVHTHYLGSSDAFMRLSIQAGQAAVTSPVDLWKYFVGIREPDEADRQSGREGDWIELHNPTEADVNLEGWSLSDSATNIRKWVFPAVILPAKGYLVVLATGEDRRDPSSWLETSFKLSSSGEFLGLYDPQGVPFSRFSPEYPPQTRGTSYGWNESSQSYRVFIHMTPGWRNGEASFEGVVGKAQFSVQRGFYDEAFEVEMSTETEGAVIRYTTDGSTPSDTHGAIYGGPIPVSTTTILRALAYREGFLSSRVETHSFIFIDNVIGQDNRPEGYPLTWKNTSNNPDLPADYEMDPEVTQNPLYRDKLRPALLSIPTISLVTDKEHFFDRHNGLYMNPQNSGMAWERPVSVEWLHPNGQEGFQINAGIRIQGGHTRSPNNTPKRSFRLAFRKAYGDGTLTYPLFPEPTATDNFDTLILRGAGNQSWLHHNTFRGDNRGRAQYIRDQFAKDMQGRMGTPHLHNTYAFLYINGLFWGLYNPTERATNAFGEAYLGGDEEDYDAINSGRILDGDGRAWNELLARVDRDLSIKLNYDRVGEWLNLEHFTDYMLLNHWGGNEDWDHHNWYALRNRLGGKFHFFAWDSEFFFETATADVTGKNTPNNPGWIFHSLLKNAEYRMLVADRIHRHFSNDGALTTPVALQMWEERTAQVYEALIAESARWGDYRRDVHRRGGPHELYARDNQWLKERQRLLKTVIPMRHSVTLSQYNRMGLIPSTLPPAFSRPGGVLTDEAPLVILNPHPGSSPIYYTLDGSDPRSEGGAVAPAAALYSHPIHPSKRTRIQARVLRNAVWSPLQGGDFHPAGDPADLQISEILYAPLDAGSVRGKELEFIEIRNAGPARISLDQVELADGIQFSFPPGLFLEPDAYTVVVSNLAAFQAHRRVDRIDGQFSGHLSNSGERIVLQHATLGMIQELVYSDWYPWPEEASLAGHSLIPVSLANRGFPTQSRAWRASPRPGGTPGTSEFSNAQWLFHPTLGWVYSETGEITPGTWLYGNIGFFYLGTLEDYGNWIWARR